MNNKETYLSYYKTERFIAITKFFAKGGLAQVLVFSLSLLPLHAQQKTNYLDCSVQWNDSLLVLENSRIRRTFYWNKGNLITKSLRDKRTSHVWEIANKSADISYPGIKPEAENVDLKVVRQPLSPLSPAYLEVSLTSRLGSLELKRIFRLYPDCPAIASDFYYRGRSVVPWASPMATAQALEDEPVVRAQSKETAVPIIERLQLPGNHWHFTSVRFSDATDQWNTLVQTTSVLGYRRPVFLRGNLIFADDKVQKRGFFLLKEAPAPGAQVAYPGSDFQTDFDELKVLGAGLNSSDLETNTWKRGYGVVLGVYGSEELDKLTALRTYQKQIRRHLPERDEMIMMNTWGDRNKDASVGESFLLKELEAGARLGITYLQIDDGWQQGLSKNSAVANGRLWDDWDAASWQPHRERFPNGLAPVVRKASELGIQLGLWFHPSNVNSYARWETDANIIIGLYRQYGIRTFKIDGIELPDNQAEINLQRFFEAVLAATEGKVVFNLDATAGKRSGYHFLNQYGNIFLENRYTDFGNYYPYWTLRNLWMLSRYVPPENLQVEFLNKWRNPNKYPANDPFAPLHIPFNYIFAITIMGQPLAWFEASNLPDEAFNIAPLVKAYRERQADLHAGLIFPVGEEPSGRSWTGFQSIRGQEGYILVFRENNEQAQTNLKTWLPPGQTVKLTALLGHGKSFRTKTQPDGRLAFRLSSPNSFALYHYQLK